LTKIKEEEEEEEKTTFTRQTSEKTDFDKFRTQTDGLTVSFKDNNVF